eukprot:4141358-Prymnesium_polylepis.1
MELVVKQVVCAKWLVLQQALSQPAQARKVAWAEQWCNQDPWHRVVHMHKIANVWDPSSAINNFGFLLPLTKNIFISA